MILHIRNSWLLILFWLLSACLVEPTQAASFLVKEKQTTQADSLAYGSRPGEEHRFWLDYDSQSLADFRPLFEGQEDPFVAPPSTTPLTHAVHARVQGEWRVTIIKDQGQKLLVSSLLIDPQVTFTLNDQQAVAEEEALSRELSLPVLVQVFQTGKVAALFFAKEQRSVTQGFVRAMLGITQMVLPDTRLPGSTWETEEEDSSGIYIAQYDKQEEFQQSQEAPKILSFRKRKLRYLPPVQELRPDEIFVEQLVVPTGQLTGTFNLKDGHLSTLIGSFVDTNVIAGKKVARSENRITLKHLKTSMISPTALAESQALADTYQQTGKTMPLFAEPEPEEAELAIQRSELGEDTVESLLKDLAQREASPQEGNSTSLYLKFKALVYLKPDVCPELGTLLKTAPPDSLTMGLLSGVFGEVGHAEAQRALVAAIEYRMENLNALLTLIPALGFVPVPIPEAEQLLRRIAEQSLERDIRTTAELALGNMTRNLSQVDSVRAKRMMEWMHTLLRGAKDDARREQLVLVLGNAGMPEAFPLIAPFLTNPSSSIRSAATLALRWIDHPDVDARLAQTLTTDRVGEVRLNAAMALSFRLVTSQTFQAQKTALLTDKNEKVRLQVLANIWNGRRQYPEVTDLVKEVAQKDTSKDVRQAAQELLNATGNVRS